LNPFELIGYADLTVFHEIWSKHSLIGMKLSIVELDRSIKGYPIKIKEKYESYFA